MTGHTCFHAKRQQLVKELNQVVDAQMQFLNSLKDNGASKLIVALDDPKFIYLVEREDIIQAQLEKIDRTDNAY